MAHGAAGWMRDVVKAAAIGPCCPGAAWGRGNQKRAITGVSWLLWRLSVGVGQSVPDLGSLPTAVAQRLYRPNWIFNVAKTVEILSRL